MFIPAAPLPHSLQQLVVETPDVSNSAPAHSTPSQQLQRLIRTSPALPCLVTLQLKVSTSDGLSLSAAELADVKLPNLQDFKLTISFHLYNLEDADDELDELYGSAPLDLTWLGFARTFRVQLHLHMWEDTELVGMLQHTLRSGDSLSWQCPTMPAESRQLLEELELASLEIVCEDEDGDEDASSYDEEEWLAAQEHSEDDADSSVPREREHLF